MWVWILLETRSKPPFRAASAPTPLENVVRIRAIASMRDDAPLQELVGRGRKFAEIDDVGIGEDIVHNPLHAIAEPRTASPYHKAWRK